MYYYIIINNMLFEQLTNYIFLHVNLSKANLKMLFSIMHYRSQSWNTDFTAGASAF